MYLPKPWTLNEDVMESEYAIFEQTFKEHEAKGRICSGLIALLYELLLRVDGDALPEVYPVNTDQRAKRFLTLVYSSNAFLYSSSTLDLAFRGRYVEAEAILRSLIENVAFEEYFSKNLGECLSFFDSLKGIPNKKMIFRFLEKHGEFPKGGPEKVIARFHASAHANIHSRMKSWLLYDDANRIVGFRVHQYDSDAFVKISHHLIMPLLGTHQFFYEAFKDRLKDDEDLHYKWNLGRPFKQIKMEFPDLWFILKHLD